ncbi:TerD family protein [Streptomyces sp. NRRL S-813]|uniref:TerD family protein n=1 Tax=Streptomyces sp. NRRL S-813 TaxID=1463919 RepID=UPI000A8AE061|nr:TerD family protein [Streptomyces sp. NRRL S-813]
MAYRDHPALWHGSVLRAAPFTSGETVSIVVEIYRHASGWKVRAVGQGSDTGLAGLAAEYGIDVEP